MNLQSLVNSVYYIIQQYFYEDLADLILSYHIGIYNCDIDGGGKILVKNDSMLYNDKIIVRDNIIYEIVKNRLYKSSIAPKTHATLIRDGIENVRYIQYSKNSIWIFKQSSVTVIKPHKVEEIMYKYPRYNKFVMNNQLYYYDGQYIYLWLWLIDVGDCCLKIISDDYLIYILSFNKIIVLDDKFEMVQEFFGCYENINVIYDGLVYVEYKSSEHDLVRIVTYDGKVKWNVEYRRKVLIFDFRHYLGLHNEPRYMLYNNYILLL